MLFNFSTRPIITNSVGSLSILVASKNPTTPSVLFGIYDASSGSDIGNDFMENVTIIVPAVPLVLTDPAALPFIPYSQ
jgi:hypothetical protein